MLATVDPALLDRVGFPLGSSTKDEIRAEARAAGLAGRRPPREPGGVLPRGRRLPRVPPPSRRRGQPGSDRRRGGQRARTPRRALALHAGPAARDRGRRARAAVRGARRDRDEHAGRRAEARARGQQRRGARAVVRAGRSRSRSRFATAHPRSRPPSRSTETALTHRARASRRRRCARSGRRALRRRRGGRRRRDRLGDAVASPRWRLPSPPVTRPTGVSRRFLVLLGVGSAFALFKLGRLFDRVSSFVSGTERDLLPVVVKSGGTVDRVNYQLDKLDTVTDSAVGDGRQRRYGGAGGLDCDLEARREGLGARRRCRARGLVVQEEPLRRRRILGRQAGGEAARAGSRRRSARGRRPHHRRRARSRRRDAGAAGEADPTPKPEPTPKPPPAPVPDDAGDAAA